MKEAGINVVRMGESTWSLWEPEDGHFEYAWMDRVVDAMGKAGIKVILGTPTYSIPTWMYHEHPEVLVEPLTGPKPSYGMRQNMDITNPTFRFYAQRLIRNLVEHYRNNPIVIGWQIDNETGAYNANNPEVFTGFVDHLKQKFGTTDNLNKAWFLNYWGEDVNGWENMPPRQNATSTGYKLEWSRWQQMRVTDYLTWQAAIVREYRRPDQFVTQDFSDAVHRDELDLVILSRYGHARAPSGQGLREWDLGQDPLTLCVPRDHPLADAGVCAMARLADELWVLSPDTTLGRLVTSMCVTAVFQPRLAATVGDVGTAIGLVGIGWGITIAPELTPADPAEVSRLRITGVDVVRHSVLLVRDGEHLSPRMAAAISAVRAVGLGRPADQPASGR